MDTYEKKYKNALTIAQSRFKIEKDESVLTCLGMMFPELRESEDERIRKELIEFIKWSVDRHFMREDFHQSKRPSEWIAYLEKQKGDKDELVYRLNGLMQDYIKEGKDDEEKEHRLKCYQLFWDALEDANFFEQKEQKPAWSKEDEFRLKEALEVLDESIRHLPIGYGYVTDVMNVTKWLKSLRPSWKPSEEQMDALKELIDDANRAGWVTPGATELYEQLKKL